MGDYGAKIALPGNNVYGSDAGLLFTTKNWPVKTIMSGTLSTTIPANQGSDPNTPAIVVPYAVINPNYTDSQDPQLIVFASIEGSIYRNNLNGGTAVDDWLVYPYTVHNNALNADFCYLNITRTSASASWGSTVTVTCRYYIQAPIG